MIIRALAICLISLSLSLANDDGMVELVNDYRLNGLGDIVSKLEKKFEKELQSPKYWNSYIKSKDTTWGYYETIENVFVCSKETNKFHFYKLKNNKYELDSDIFAFVGENRGNKLSEGDLRTPVGAYVLTKKLSTVDQFYGPLAFVTSYPNMYDRINNRNGSGIWIHGLPINGDRPFYTKGCIALDNNYMVKLSKDIDIDKTILLSYENHPVEAEKADIALVLATLYQWRVAWRDNDLKKYLSYYSEEEFKRADGMSFRDFVKYKDRIFSKNEKKSITFTNIDVAPYPTNCNKKIFRVTYFQDYRASTYASKSVKELYFLVKDGKAKILVEQ